MAEFVESLGIDKEVADAFKDGNMERARKIIASKLNRWKTIPLNIAVVGSSGSGKSTLINAMRGISNNHEKAAAVGIAETTMKCTPYEHPTNDQFVMWDIPGVGTANFPKASYLDKIGFSKYDFFVICSATRFSENDIWLADEIYKLEKRFYLLRTKIDIDLRNEKDDHPDTFDEMKLLQKLRVEYKKQFNKDYQLFIVSSKRTEQWDYPVFQKALLRDIPGEKREALVLSLQAHSTEAIKQKKAVLGERIHNAAMLSSVCGFIPLPGVGAKVDIAILIKEGNFFKEQLGITEEAISMTARHAGTTMNDCTDLQLKTVLVDFTVEPMIQFAGRAVAVKELGKTALAFVPILGWTISARLSFLHTSEMLTMLLDQITEDALKVAEYFNKKSASQM